MLCTSHSWRWLLESEYATIQIRVRSWGCYCISDLRALIVGFLKLVHRLLVEVRDRFRLGIAQLQLGEHVLLELLHDLDAARALAHSPLQLPTLGTGILGQRDRSQPKAHGGDGQCRDNSF